MNIFELNVVASPVGGLVGGLSAAKGMSGVSTALAIGAGVVVGVGLYFGVLGAGWVTAKIAGVEKPTNRKSLDKAGTILSIVVLLPMLVMPFISAWTAHLLVEALFR
jgi:hypothetical protein